MLQEKAQQGPGADPCEPVDDDDELIADGSEASRLLDWPQLELERVNSFLTSRLEEIKNTIKDSIRASFSMYDLNLDVNDFPKKAATLEGNHLLSHLNGSSDLQQMDLDLAPLSLGTFKSHLDLVNGWEDTSTGSSPNTTATSTASGVAAGPKDIQRLHTTPSLSKLIRVRSPERYASSGSDGLPPAPAQATAKSNEDAPKNTTAGAAGAKSKKNKKQQRQEQLVSEPNAKRATKAGSGECKEASSHGSKAGNKPAPAEPQRNGPKRAEEGRSSKQAGANRGRADAGGGRGEQEADSRAPPAARAKNKKNRNKGERSSSAIGTRSPAHPETEELAGD